MACRAWSPAAGLGSVNAAVPSAASAAVIGMPPSTASVTAPAGAGTPASAATVTVTTPSAFHVTAGPGGATAVGAGFTVSVAAAELPAKCPCAGYSASSEWVPAAGAVMVNTAAPAERG